MKGKPTIRVFGVMQWEDVSAENQCAMCKKNIGSATCEVYHGNQPDGSDFIPEGYGLGERLCPHLVLPTIDDYKRSIAGLNVPTETIRKRLIENLLAGQEK